MRIVAHSNDSVNHEESRWVIVCLGEDLRPESFVVPEVTAGIEDPRARLTYWEAAALCAELTAQFGTLHICLYLDHDGNLRFPDGEFVGRRP